MSEKGEPVKIGITGGIGSGKSLVCQVFRQFGIPVYDADSRARYLMENDETVKTRIRENFTDQAFDGNQLDRKFLAGEIFNNGQKLQLLNQIVHPAVNADFETWVSAHQGKKFIIKEAALLFETGSYKKLDKVILIYCPLETRIKRVLLRDRQRTRQDVGKIIEKQWSDNEKKKLADFVITNDDFQPVIPQVLSILDLLFSR